MGSVVGLDECWDIYSYVFYSPGRRMVTVPCSGDDGRFVFCVALCGWSGPKN